MRLLFYIINLVFYGVGLFFLVINYKNFRVTGGIHGQTGHPKPKIVKEIKESPEKNKKKKKGDVKKEGLTDNLLEEGSKPSHHDQDNERGPGRAWKLRY